MDPLEIIAKCIIIPGLGGTLEGLKISPNCDRNLCEIYKDSHMLTVWEHGTQ